MMEHVKATTLPSQLATVGRVITALVLREAKTRFGRNQFGFIWILLEPLAFVGVFITLRTFAERSIPFGESLVLFVLTGLLVFRMFSAISTRVMSAITSNRALLAYPPVRPVDTILARIVLETLAMYIVWTLFFSIVGLTMDHKAIVNHVYFAQAVAVTTLLAAGVGTLNAVLSVLFPTWERIWAILRLPLLFLSGIFYVPILTPPMFQWFASWNPVLHCVEWLRTGTYLTYEPLLDPAYVIGFGVSALALGLLLERTYRYKLLAGG